jgi:hypothetical protein
MALIVSPFELLNVAELTVLMELIVSRSPLRPVFARFQPFAEKYNMAKSVYVNTCVYRYMCIGICVCVCVCVYTSECMYVSACVNACGLNAL